MKRIKLLIAVAMAMLTLLASAATPATAQDFFVEDGHDAFVEDFSDVFGDDFDEDDFDEEDLDNCEFFGFDEFTGEALVLCEVDFA